jgi:hypothetical protein
MNYDERRRRMDRARFAVHAEVMIGVAVSFLTWFLFIASPGCLCGMIHEPPLIERLTPWVAVVGPIVGLVWMFWLSRPMVEAGERDWRYRDF